RYGRIARAQNSQGLGGRHLATGRKGPGRGPLKDLPPVRARPFRAHPRADGLSDPAVLLWLALDPVERPSGGAVRSGGTQVLPVRHGAVAAGCDLSGGTAGAVGLCPVPV